MCGLLILAVQQSLCYQPHKGNSDEMVNHTNSNSHSLDLLGVLNNNPTKVADLKLVLLGESAVGKSFLAQRFTTDTFDTNKESTIGAAFITKKIYIEELDDLKLINFQIWDTAGQERYKSLTPMYYRNSNIAFIVFDLTDQLSFKKAETWYNELMIFNGEESKNLKIYLVGNKSDLINSQDAVVEVPNFEKFPFVIDNGIKIIRTSAKTGDGVDKLFEEVINNIDDSSFVSVEELEQGNNNDSNNKRLKNKKSGIIDLSSFRNSNESNCSC